MLHQEDILYLTIYYYTYIQNTVKVTAASNSHSYHNHNIITLANGLHAKASQYLDMPSLVTNEY